MKKTLYWVLIGIFGLIFAISTYVVVDYLIESKQSKDLWESVAAPFDEFDETEPSSSRKPTTPPSTSGVVVPTIPTTVPTPTIPGTTVPMPTDPGVTAPNHSLPTPTIPDPTIPDGTEPGVTEPVPGTSEPTSPVVHVHTYVDSVVEPTCTDGGFTLHFCECGHIYQDSEVAATGHNYGAWQYGNYSSKDYQRPRTRQCANCDETESQNVLSRFEWYLKNNKDVVGYIRIVNDPDAKNSWDKYLVNYPILHHPAEKDYYLKRNFYKQDDEHGSIYLRESCDMFAPTDVLTIYGHAMADGSMFGRLNRYRTKSFFYDHQYIQVWDLYEEHTYQVVCVFKTSGTYGVGFPFHLFDDFEDEEEYEEFINGARDIAMFDTGIQTQYGDQFICLCTCEYTLSNGRLVLLAKRIS